MQKTMQKPTQEEIENFFEGFNPGQNKISVERQGHKISEHKLKCYAAMFLTCEIELIERIKEPVPHWVSDDLKQYKKDLAILKKELKIDWSGANE